MPGDDQRYSKWVAERFTLYSTCMWFAIARPSFLIEKKLLFHGRHWETYKGKGWLWELWQQILDVDHVRFQIPLFVFWLRTGQTTRMPVSFSVYCDIHKFHAMPIPAMLLGNLARSFPLQVSAHAMVNAILCGLASLLRSISNATLTGSVLLLPLCVGGSTLYGHKDDSATISEVSAQANRQVKSSQRGSSSNQLHCTFTYIFQFPMPGLQCLADFHGFAAYLWSKVSQKFVGPNLLWLDGSVDQPFNDLLVRSRMMAVRMSKDTSSFERTGPMDNGDLLPVWDRITMRLIWHINERESDIH